MTQNHNTQTKARSTPRPEYNWEVVYGDWRTWEKKSVGHLNKMESLEAFSKQWEDEQ